MRGFVTYGMPTSAPSITLSPVPSLCLRTFHCQYLGSYIVSVNSIPVFSLFDVEAQIAQLLQQDPAPLSVDLVFAPECHSAFDDHPSPLHLCMHDLCQICALQLVSGEGLTFNQYQATLEDFVLDVTDVELSAVIH
jgi:hypothetical protein